MSVGLIVGILVGLAVVFLWLNKGLSCFDGNAKTSPNQKQEPRTPQFQVRVVSFGNPSNDYYVVEYSNDSGSSWTRLTRAFMFSDNISLWDLEQPVIGMFEQMVAYAKRFKSIDQINTHLESEKKQFEFAYQKAQEEFQQRRERKWTSV